MTQSESDISHLLADLNPQQKLAVQSVNGRVLILAGAGSGKTRVLTTRMAYLIKHLKVPSTAILGLTFTNKAAAEMRHRMSNLVEPYAAKRVTLSTFHSFCMQVLRHHIHHIGYSSNFTIYNENDIRRLIKWIARDLLKHESAMPSLEKAILEINKAKCKGLKSEEITVPDSKWLNDFTQTIYKRLQDAIRIYNAVDFDSLLYLTLELFEKHPDVLDLYQERYRYIMIDEYQDTNNVQFKLAKYLSAKYHNLCVVGDDDQSIYGWRGANIRNILDFDNATVIKLEQNYRSSNTILKAANAVIGKNGSRHEKKLWSQRGEGEKIQVFYAPGEIEEAQAVVGRLLQLKKSKDLAWRDIAILYRSNALSRHFELTLLKYRWHDGQQWITGIPYQVVGGLEFFERQEIKDLFGYLRFIVNRKDQEALLRIINQPRRGIGMGTLESLSDYVKESQIPFWDLLKSLTNGETPNMIQEKIDSRALKGIKQFVNVIEQSALKFEQLPMHEAMVWMLKEIDYESAIQDEASTKKGQNFKWDNVQEFVTSMFEYEFGGECQTDLDKEEKDLLTELSKEEKPSLAQFIANFPLGSHEQFHRNRKAAEGNKVQMMTLHSAKGLEFPACYIVGVEAHILPHEKSMKETGLEEERRLMYVGITRAMRYLTISMATKRNRMGKEMLSQPSPFVMEIPKELIQAVAWNKF